jgi:CheY-like chemotaxis protein
VGSFESLAAQMKLDLIFHTDEEEIMLYFDSEKIEKAIGNIIANAVKFTPAGGKITVTAAARPAKEENHPPGYLEITICDTGIGIPEEQLPYIFNRFYQADGYFSHEHKHKGSGIGLTLAKELVNLHHGDIHVISQEGKGTEFTIRLPLGKEHLKPEDIPGDEIPAFTFDGRPAALEAFEEYESAEKKEESPIETGTNGKDVILIVEDNPDVRQFIRGPLRVEYTVIEAADGEEGIEKAREIIPDLVISDVMMPRKDGFQLCHILKKDVKTSHIPIILLTRTSSTCAAACRKPSSGRCCCSPPRLQSPPLTGSL